MVMANGSWREYKPILWEALHILHNKYEVPNFLLATHFTPLKLITFLKEWGKILSLWFEGQFTTRITRCRDNLNTSLA
jgi:hypothetical protein